MLKKTMIAGIALFMLSCGNSKKEEQSLESGSVFDKVSNLSKVASSAGKVEELTNKLKGLTPLTNDELKAVVPETLNGLKRKSYNAGGLSAVGGLSSIEAEYGDDTKYIKVGIMDGAGETGSAMVSLLALSLSMNTESENADTKTKTTEINGIRTLTEDTKRDESVSSSIKYLYKDRYSISLDGNGYTLSELESFMKELNTSALK
jgi:hypothetical protein